MSRWTFLLISSTLIVLYCLLVRFARMLLEHPGTAYISRAGAEWYREQGQIEIGFFVRRARPHRSPRKTRRMPIFRHTERMV